MSRDSVRRPSTAVRAIACAAAMLSLSGCSPLYVLRAGVEEAKFLWRRQAITATLADTSLDATARARLETVLEAREFAASVLGLRVGGSFTSWARVDEEQVVHVVAAAERFRLEPFTWWFPIVGHVPYKGYFQLDDARAEAARLESSGYDTIVRPSVAFSTLGWFDDPLPSTLLDRDEVALVNTVIHELLHNTRYFASQADFAESFANFVGHRGAIEFFQRAGRATSEQQAEQDWQLTLRYGRFLTEFASRLRAAYASGVSPEGREALFADGQEELRRLSLADTALGRVERGSLNNAMILGEILYHRDLDLFEDLWRASGKDLRRTIDTVLRVTDGRDDPFAAVAATIGRP